MQGTHKDARIPLVLEAEPVQQVNTPAVWFRILKAVNSKYFRAYCDVAHINVFSNQKPLELLKELQPYIGYTHLAGNDGTCTKIESRSSTHLSLNEGSIELEGHAESNPRWGLRGMVGH